MRRFRPSQDGILTSNAATWRSGRYGRVDPIAIRWLIRRARPILDRVFDQSLNERRPCLKTVLDAENTRLPFRIAGTGRSTGARLMSRGHIYWILSNPIYVGRLRHQGLDSRRLACRDRRPRDWDRVQRQLAEQTQTRADPIAIPNSFLRVSFTTIGAIGWLQATRRMADSAGAIMSRGLC